jgi:hypothetical protein
MDRSNGAKKTGIVAFHWLATAVIDDGINGFLVHQRTALYANKINELLQNASLRQEFVRPPRKAIANLVLQLEGNKVWIL